MCAEQVRETIRSLTDKIKKAPASDEEKQLVIGMLEQFIENLVSQNADDLWEAGKFLQVIAGYVLAPKDELYQAAFRLYSKAAEKGYPSALRSVGQCFMLGLGVPKDESKGVQYYQQAAELGNELAAVDLATSYFTGAGIEQNQDKAIKILEEKAAQKSAEAMDVLGSCYYTLGNYEKADYWFELAFENGCAVAALKQANIYLFDSERKKDIEKGTALLKKAADAGNPDAQFYLAKGILIWGKK